MDVTEVQEEDIIESILAQFSSDLWIERRLKLDEVMDRLEERQSNIGRDWHQFIRFLEEHCSGLKISLLDKQWGELLNLMMISRKLNHKSVKFKDILANKQQIECNAQRIMDFNETAKLGLAVDSGFNDLEQLIQSTRLSCWSGNHDNGSELMSDRLIETRSHLYDNCRPLIYNLKLSLQDERAEKDPRFVNWQIREAKLSAILNKMSDFISALISLQSKLSKIKYLDTATTETAVDDDAIESKDASALKSKVRVSIELCRREMRDIQEFYQKSIAVLHQVSNRTINQRTMKSSGGTGFLLIKVFEPREFISTGDIKLAIDKLDGCQRRLDEIMRNLRREFGRFYFLSDLELLTVVMIDIRLITDQSAEKKRMICKLFNNSLSSFRFDKQGEFLTGVQSTSDEVISFAKEDFVPLRKAVQVYSLEVVRILNEVQRKLRRTLKSMLMKSLVQNSDSHDWSLPVQLVILAEYIKFCSRVEEVLSSSSSNFSSLIDLYERQSQLLSEPTFYRSSAQKISTAISMNVHFISSLMSMRRKKVSRVGDWLWQKQVRYYVINDEGNSTNELEVRIADAKFQYKFNYLCIDQNQSTSSEQQQKGGCIGFKRLITTKITERCFLMASQAVYHLRLGANPFGPAGGGKTETIKALGHLLGHQVIVHNCDETNDIESLDRLIWGWAHTGLWGCFDEFNRLSSSTMSVVSATLELVQSSIRENKTTVEQQNCRNDQDRSLMCIDRDSAFFITLNPASGGPSPGLAPNTNRYKGRRRLPANLRNLFLPISMVRVQIDSIVRENLLALSIELRANSNDAESIIEIGLKMQNFLHRMRQLNLGGDRCEWDLRLVMASLQRLRISIAAESERRKNLRQQMVEALCTEVEPRLSDAEFIEFRRLLSLQEFGLDWVLNEFSIMASNSQSNRKLEYLRRQLETRTGVLLVGGARSGKSSAWKKLFSKEIDSTPTMKWIALNPKFCSQQELFGGFFGGEKTTTTDPRRGKWCDGYFTSKVREALDMLQAEPYLKQVCIILDGPIDPDWIESLNSVLDDNRVLTLGSGERLNFSLSDSQQSIKLIFETNSIEFASPATISRLGLVYFEELQESSLMAEVTIDRIQELDKYLNSGRLVIICGQNLDYLEIERFFRQNDLLGTIYSCNENSDSSHLMDLLSCSPSQKSYLIHNVDSIIAQDQWGTRTFLELLRFCVDYRGYYDDQCIFKSIGSNVRFVLTCQKLDQRIASKSSLIVHMDGGKASPVKPEQSESKTIIEILEHYREDSLLVIINKIHLSAQELNLQLSTNLTDSGQKIVHQFGSTQKAQESLDYLDKQSRMDACEGSSQGVLLVLHDHELQLLDKDMKAKLLHRLNWLRGVKIQARLIFVCSQENISSQFKSMARVIVLDGDENEVFREVKNLLANTFKQEEILHWLHTGIFNGCSSGYRDKEKIESLVNAVLMLYQESSSSLTLRQKALKNGLNNLLEFDKKVEQMRIECQQQELLLQEKYAQIKQTSKAIAATLKASEQQKTQVNELSRELELKRLKMLKKSETLELELAKVSPMLEASRTEIKQHLKPEALNEIKTLRAPPKTIKDILDALFILLGARDLTWSSMKSYLASRSLKDELTNYEFQHRISEDMLSSVERLISSEKGCSFNPEQAKRASRAIVPLLNWIQSAREYGKVLIKSGPLRDELQHLNTELAELNQSVRSAETQLEQINRDTQEQEESLSDLRKESEKLKKETAHTRHQLIKSQQLRNNLENQTNRWDQDLHKIDSLLSCSHLRLFKMCFMAISLAFHYTIESMADSKRLRNNLSCWLDEYDLASDDDQVPCRDWIEFIRDSQFGLVLDLNDVDLSCELHSDESRILELLSLRQFIKFIGPPWLPLIYLETLDQLGEDEILESFCHGNVLGLRTDEISYVRFQSDLNQLQQQTASGCKKLICLDIRNISPDSMLNLAYFLFNRRTNSNLCKIVLLSSRQGKFEQSLGRYLVEFPHVIETYKDREPESQVQASILNSILQIKEPLLLQDLERKQIDLRKNQKVARANEITLLSQLVSSTSSSTTSRRAMSENFADIVRILDELQQLNSELTNDWEILENLRQTADSRRLDYLEDSLESARFYTEFLAPIRGFSCFSVRKYTQLLLTATEQSDVAATTTSSASESELRANIKLIVRHVVLAMNPRQRLEFGDRVHGAKFADDADRLLSSLLCEDEVRANPTEEETEGRLGAGSFPRLQQQQQHQRPQAKTQLGKIILRNVQAESGQQRRVTRASASNRCQLIVVLHDPSKSSSPQQELDYLLAGGGGTSSEAAHVLLEMYDKVYATGDRLGQARLEATLRKFASSAPRLSCKHIDDNSNTNNKGFSLTTETKPGAHCLCVVNAHLSSEWLNANLIDCLEKPFPDYAEQPGSSSSSSSLAATGNGNDEQMRLLILIGEASESEAGSLFDRRILDYAQLRYWHDELALSLFDRFDTFLGSTTSYDDNILLEQLRRQIILLHVVCQERVKIGQGKGWLYSAYSFDYDQLNLALKTLGRLANKAEQKQLSGADLRAQLCNYMADIVYGSRMETIEDELELEKLIKRFLGGGQEQLQALEELRVAAVGGQQRQQDYDQLLGKLIGFRSTID